MQDRKQLDTHGILTLLLLCMIWGSQQVILKLAAADISPMLLIALRSGVAAIIIAGLGHLAGQQRWLRGVAWPGAIVGTLFAAEFMFVAEGLRWTTASHMSVFLYTAPIFAAIGLHWKVPQERLGGVQWIGIGIGFAGIALAFTGASQLDRPSIDASRMLFGDVLGVLAGASWGLTTVVVRTTRLSDAPATQTLFLQLIGAFVWLLPIAMVTGQMTFHSTPVAWSSLAFQTLVVAVFSFLVWFRMLRRYLASRMGVFSFLTPIFGVGFARWLLDDPLTPNFLIGAGIVLAGVIVVNDHRRLSMLFVRRG